MRRWTKKTSAAFAFLAVSFVAALPQGAKTTPEEVAPSIPQKESEELRKPTPVVEALGGERYRVGSIEVDKRQNRFTVPGRILRDEPPLEFLAVTRGGFKGYESLLELDTNAFEFNTACLLIGLNPDKGKPPTRHFDPAPTEGDPVEIWISWVANEKSTRVEAAGLVRQGEKTLPRGHWVYTGSTFNADGRYMADVDGALIGFVHDPSSIIEHRGGFGLGEWGSVGPNRSLAPPAGTRINLTVEVRGE